MLTIALNRAEGYPAMHIQVYELLTLPAVPLEIVKY